jgi:hypothetical protein
MTLVLKWTTCLDESLFAWKKPILDPGCWMLAKTDLLYPVSRNQHPASVHHLMLSVGYGLEDPNTITPVNEL